MHLAFFKMSKVQEEAVREHFKVVMLPEVNSCTMRQLNFHRNGEKKMSGFPFLYLFFSSPPFFYPIQDALKINKSQLFVSFCVIFTVILPSFSIP